MLKHIAVVINPVRPIPADVLTFIKDTLTRLGVKSTWLETIHAKTPRQVVNNRIEGEFDLILAIGGDQAVIQSAHRSYRTGIPILGINSGHLGFLSCIHPQEVLKRLPSILEGAFRVEHRTPLETRVYRNNRLLSTGWGLNEALIERRTPSIIHLQGTIQRQLIAEFNVDGLIVATPTGSTAYNLSAGGPLLSPESRVFTLTPICPHTLTNRSLVIEMNKTVNFELTRDTDKAVVRVDGLTLSNLDAGMHVEVTGSAYEIPIAFLPETNYYATVRDNLQWHNNVIRHPTAAN